MNEETELSNSKKGYGIPHKRVTITTVVEALNMDQRRALAIICGATDPETVILNRDELAAVCDHYCRFPREYDEDLHGIPLAESEICKKCPLTLAAERENTDT